MANPAFETVDPPYTAFRFEVVLDLADPPPGVTNPVCNAAFAECDGLEMSIEPKTVREGGNNREQIHLVGKVSYGQLTLKRGMTANLQLWTWMAAAAQPGRVSHAEGRVTLWDADGTPRVTFVLRECFPTRLRGPSLNAKDGLVAIEEMQLVYRSLEVRLAGDGAGFSVGGGIGFSAGAGASFGVGGGLSVSGGVGLSGSASASLSFG
ncbi:MAG: phage tail protein [Caldilineales bacterium]|nr:phage tail protein [Caldilineales bacterium]MDW8318323.1 phage tail protein [Anaerolineae bacterium]